MSLGELPEEVLLEQSMLLPIEDVLAACESNRQFARICQRRDFWYRRTQKDFPEYTLLPPSEVPDPRALYIWLYGIRRTYRDRIWHELSATYGNRFWILGARQNPGLMARRGDPYLIPNTAYTYAATRYPGRQGYDQFVLWPDLRVAGTVNQIVDILRKAGFKTVPIGELYRLTNGQMGSPSGKYPLTEQLIYENSLNPLNRNQDQIILNLNERMWIEPTQEPRLLELFFG